MGSHERVNALIPVITGIDENVAVFEIAVHGFDFLHETARKLVGLGSKVNGAGEGEGTVGFGAVDGGGIGLIALGVEIRVDFANAASVGRVGFVPDGLAEHLG